MNKKRILLAENEALTAMDLKTSLVQLGYEVPAVVSSGEDVIRIAAEMHPDLVLMDITLAGQMSGIEAADEIKKTLAIPVVFLTAHTDAETIDKAKKSGPFGYLPKHVDNTNLAIAIDFALYKSDADARIRESEERYRSVVEDQTELICRYREDGSLSFVNGAYARYYGKSHSDLINRNFIPNIPEPDLSVIKLKLAGITLENPVAVFEHRIIMPDGEERWQQWTHRGIYSADVRLLEYQAVGYDITERKKLEEEKEHLASFPQLDPDPVIEVSSEGKIIFHNNASIETLRILGIKEDVGLFLPDDISDILKDLEQKSRSSVYRVKKINENYFGEDIYLSPEFNAVRIYANDITERRKAEEALKRALNELEARVIERTSELAKLNEELRISQEQLRNLTAHLQAVREEERTRIAREIHDELGQIMTALKMDMSWIVNNYGDHEDLNLKAESMLSLIDETIRTVRRIITELRPGILDHLGISAAMEWQAEEFQRVANIPCNIVITPEEIMLSKDLSINMFRIFQEILTNIMRHSEATSVNVLLKQNDGVLILKVEDNGKGIAEAEISNPTSFGIMGMSERVNYMRGSLHIGGIPREGTMIEVIVPIESLPR